MRKLISRILAALFVVSVLFTSPVVAETKPATSPAVISGCTYYLSPAWSNHVTVYKKWAVPTTTVTFYWANSSWSNYASIYTISNGLYYQTWYTYIAKYYTGYPASGVSAYYGGYYVKLFVNSAYYWC